MLIETATKIYIPFTEKPLRIPSLLDSAKNHLDNYGVLKYNQNENYCYLKIDDAYIHNLFPLLPPHSKNKLHSPPYFNFKGAAGAHISVMYAEEVIAVRDKLQKEVKIEEIGNRYNFKIIDLYSIEVFKKELIVLIVSSPDLAAIRKKYGFAPKLNYHGLLLPFHITIGLAYLA